MAEQDLKALQRLLDMAIKALKEDVPVIIEVEGLNFIKKNFEDEGFNTTGLEKWKARVDKDTSRSLLVGHSTGGNKLRNSFRTRRTTNSVHFITYKDYAQIHNEGGRINGTFGVRSHKRKTRSGRVATVKSHSRTVDFTMPKRQFMGKSPYLVNKISNQLTKTLDKRFKR